MIYYPEFTSRGRFELFLDSEFHVELAYPPIYQRSFAPNMSRHYLCLAAYSIELNVFLVC